MRAWGAAACKNCPIEYYIKVEDRTSSTLYRVDMMKERMSYNGYLSCWFSLDELLSHWRPGGGREVKGSWGTFPWPGISLSQSPPAPIYIQIEIQIDLFSFFETRGFTFHCDELWFTIWYKTWFKKLKLTQISTFQVCVYRGDARQGDPRRWGHATGEEFSRRSQPLTSCLIAGTIPHLSHYRRFHL